MKPMLPPQPKQIRAGMDSSAVNKPQEANAPFGRGGRVGGHVSSSTNTLSGRRDVCYLVPRVTLLPCGACMSSAVT